MSTKNESDRFLKSVGVAIRNRRNELGWTLEQVEEKGYPSWRHLQKVEAGKNITVETLFRIAKALKVKPSFFFKDFEG